MVTPVTYVGNQLLVRIPLFYIVVSSFPLAAPVCYQLGWVLPVYKVLRRPTSVLVLDGDTTTIPAAKLSCTQHRFHQRQFLFGEWLDSLSVYVEVGFTLAQSQVCTRFVTPVPTAIL